MARSDNSDCYLLALSPGPLCGQSHHSLPAPLSVTHFHCLSVSHVSLPLCLSHHPLPVSPRRDPPPPICLPNHPSIRPSLSVSVFPFLFRPPLVTLSEPTVAGTPALKRLALTGSAPGVEMEAGLVLHWCNAGPLCTVRVLRLSSRLSSVRLSVHFLSGRLLPYRVAGVLQSVPFVLG